MAYKDVLKNGIRTFGKNTPSESYTLYSSRDMDLITQFFQHL